MQNASSSNQGSKVVEPEAKIVDGLRVMVQSQLRKMCADIMKSASTKPAGHDPDAARLILGQNFLARAEDEIVTLRRQ